MLSNELEVLKECLCIALALSMGIWGYNHLTKFYRILLIQVSVYAIVYVIMELNTVRYNHFIYNIGTVLELSLLLLATAFYFRSKLMKGLLLLLYVITLSVYIVQISSKGFFQFANFGYIAGGISIVITAALILFRSFRRRSVTNNAAIFVSIGLLIYFASCTPYLSMINYLNKEYPVLSLKLFEIVNLASNLRYLLLGCAFWYLRKNNVTTVVKNG
jgi:hypothetical protein